MWSPEFIKDILNPKKVTFKIIAKKPFNKPGDNFTISLNRLDENFDNYSSAFYEKVTNEEGIVIFKDIPVGVYLIKILKKKYSREKLNLIEKDKSITIKVPLFNIFKTDIKANSKRIETLIWKFRTDKYYCFKCKIKYKDSSERFKCGKCSKFFCKTHRLPENHECGLLSGLKSPSKDLRTIYNKGGTEVRY